MLDRATILTKRELAVETVNVPEWGGDVFVAQLSQADIDAWESNCVDANGHPIVANVKAALVARCVVDEQRQRMFNDGDVEELRKQPASAIERVFRVARRLNLVGTEFVEEAKKL